MRVVYLTPLKISLLVASATFVAGVISADEPPAEISVDTHAILSIDCSSTSGICFKDTTALEDWLWTIAKPNRLAPVVVTVGPGRFGAFRCPRSKQAGRRNGWLTLRGSGTQTSSFESHGSAPALVSFGCEALAFENLSIIGRETGVEWNDGGSSKWSNTEIWAGGDQVESGAAWRDGTCREQSIHHFFGTRIVGRGARSNSAIHAVCSEVWFFGGEIMARPENPSPAIERNIAVVVAENGDVRLFGSALRSNIGPGAIVSSDGEGVIGALISNGGMFHMHGGIISLEALGYPGNLDVTGIYSKDHAHMIHTPGTSFALSPAGHGRIRRLAGETRNVDSPFLWPASDEPPGKIVGGFSSFNGQDLFVETDCARDGRCNGSGEEGHLMIYNAAACGSRDPWLDAITGRCRIAANPSE